MHSFIGHLQLSKWALWLLLTALLLPILSLLSAWFQLDTALWQHLLDTLLLEQSLNTLVLLFWVAVGTTLLGVSAAWLVARCEFPARRWFEWGLLLPFAIPAYVLAFVFLGTFDYAGPFQSWMRNQFNLNGGLDIREGVWGIALTMSLVFYPYVYLLTKQAFASQPNHFFESAQSLGASPFRRFRQIALPLARPAIIAGVTLALMEVLSDFGTVSIFNFNTLTTALYSSWHDFRSIETAAQISTLLVIFAAVLILLESTHRGQRQFDSLKTHPVERHQLRPIKRFLAMSYLTTLLTFAFILPIIQLLLWGWEIVLQEWDERYLGWIQNTLLLGLMAAGLTALLAFSLTSLRQQNTLNTIERFGIKATTLGYALPGSVLAIGVMIIFQTAESYFQLEHLISQGLIVLLLAYAIRFLAIAYQSLDSRFKTLSPNLTYAAQNLGAHPLKIAYRIYWPLLKPSLAIGFLLVFMDVIKELPATYLLRPFGWDTLAIRVFELSSEGLYTHAAVPSLMLLGLGLLGLMVVVKFKTPH